MRNACTFFVTIGLSLSLFPGTALGADPVEPFNGQNLEGWAFKAPKDRSHWKVGIATLDENNPGELSFRSVSKEGQLVNTKGGGVDIFTKEKFGDCRIELEFMVPKGSNSGVYVMGEYEVQIFDSYGKEKLGAGDLGAIYGASVPPVNAAKKPGEWQKLTIVFQAPRFQGDKKTENAKFIRVELNDQLLHQNVEMKGPTPSGVTGKEAPTGPLMFQGDHGPVAYRDIRIIPRKD